MKMKIIYPQEFRSKLNEIGEVNEQMVRALQTLAQGERDYIELIHKEEAESRNEARKKFKFNLK